MGKTFLFFETEKRTLLSILGQEQKETKQTISFIINLAIVFVNNFIKAVN